MAMVSQYTYHFLRMHLGGGHLAPAVELLSAGVLGLAAYLGAAVLLGSEETRELKALLRRR